jgi:hypothetical protein
MRRRRSGRLGWQPGEARRHAPAPRLAALPVDPRALRRGRPDPKPADDPATVRSRAAVAWEDDLALAAWLHRLGHDELAATALVVARKRAETWVGGGRMVIIQGRPASAAPDPKVILRDHLASEAFHALVHGFADRADEAALARGEWLLNRYPDLVKAERDFRQVAVLDLQFSRVSARGLDQLADLPELESLSLGDVSLTNRTLSGLVRLDRLKELRIHGHQVTDAGMEFLEPLAGLQTLSLSHTGVGDAGMESIARLPRLRSLNVETGSGLTDAGLKALTPLTGLRKFTFYSHGVTDAGLAHVGTLSRLEELRVSSRLITDAGLKALAPLTGLNSLNLSDTETTDAGLQSLAPFARLERLGLGSTRVTDDGLKHLAGLKELKVVDVLGTAVTPEGEAELGRLLPNCRVTRDIH